MENGKIPAFPITGTWTSKEMQGITKREYFAAMAMQGILSNSRGVYTEKNFFAKSPSDVSTLSLQHADELLKQLES